jgi:hypothetical protein
MLSLVLILLFLSPAPSSVDLVAHRVTQCGIQGPVAKELATWALGRQKLEDGLTRPVDQSIPGLGCGGWNRKVLNTVLEKVSLTPKMSSIRDEEGMCLIKMDGKNVQIISATTIAMLFDYYVENLNFHPKEEKRLWEQSKIDSALTIVGDPTSVERLAKQTEKRIKIIKRSNNAYGPNGSAVEIIIKKHLE